MATPAALARQRRYRRGHPDKTRELARAADQRLRQRGLDALGNQCAYCGASDPAVLTFGHVKNDGAEHRRRVGGVMSTWRDWNKRGWPKDEVELQCWNRNNGGSCGYEAALFSLHF